MQVAIGFSCRLTVIKYQHSTKPRPLAVIFWQQMI